MTGAAKSDSHAGDAEVAVGAFRKALPDPAESNKIHEPVVHSLIAAALLRAGWPEAARLIDKPCLVLSP